MGFDRRAMKINGAEVFFVCDNDRDTLADVLRNLGLTGTKIGCGTGVCGACSVILNGKLVRSCVLKMRQVKENSSVETIEGIGTAEHLHPLQVAWILYGGVQCGYCTPGFIMSAKALLCENPDPTRDEVRQWFKKHLNACRCTGYKPLVDAVIAAARVMRGEGTVDELWAMVDQDKLISTRYPKPTALGKVLGVTDFGADIESKVPEMIHLAPVLAQVAHGRIISCDFTECEKAPGVMKVITSRDVKGTNMTSFPVGLRWSKASGYNERKILSDDKICRLGDVVALVAARTRREAREAAKLAKVEYEEYPVYMDALDAVKGNAVEIHEGIPNRFITRPFYFGRDTRKVLPESAHVVRIAVGTQTQAHMPIEPETAQAFVEKDGTVTIMMKTHAVYMMPGFIAAGIGVTPDKIRIIENPCGGAFGSAFSPGMPALVGAATLAMDGRPVSLTMDYAEHQIFTGKRTQSYANLTLGCDENGKMTGVELHMLGSSGAYSEGVAASAQIPGKYLMTPYHVENGRALVHVTFTNKSIIVAYRCPAAAQLYTAQEQAVDMLAEEMGMDPMDFRLLNVWRPGDKTLNGDFPTVYVAEGIMLKMKEIYDQQRQHAAAEGTPEKPRGVGVAMGSFNISNFGDQSRVRLELNPDGSVTHYSTWEDMGQGADVGCLTYVHEGLKELGIRPDQIHLVMNDSKTCPDSGRAAASRSNLMVGLATRDACSRLLKAMKRDDGTYRTYAEMAEEGIPTSYMGIKIQPLNPNMNDLTGEGKLAPDQSYAGFVTEVEVDAATGKTRVVAMHCVTDAGTVTNQLSFEGQAYGGMQHSIGYALSEDYNDTRKCRTIVGTGFPYIDMIPDGDDFTVYNVGTKRDYAGYGGSGISEAFQSAGHVAILNAIYQAVGIRVDKMPATPEKILAAMKAKAEGTYKMQEFYDFNADFDAVLDDLKANPPAESADEEIAH